jgi:hypothetical protein
MAHFSAGVVSFITASHSKKFGLRASATRCDAALRRHILPSSCTTPVIGEFFSGGCRFTKRTELLDAVATNIGQIVAAG